eukprot:Rmarinus@m.547
MSRWIEESIVDGLRFSYTFRSQLAYSRTKFQDVELVDTHPFGKALLIDGLCQSTEVDEFVYHESLVHPALMAHPNPKTVFIAGGGEGSTARECLRHKCVERVVMVDIDADVVKFCKEHLEDNKAAFADPRLTLVIDDAEKQLREWDGKFDVIICDLDDPQPGGPCYWLYTQTFYEMCKSKLNPGGVLVTQSGPCGPVTHKQVFTPVHHTLKQVFSHVVGYRSHVWSFADSWGFNLAFSEDVAHSRMQGFTTTPEDLDKVIEERIQGQELRYYDGVCHRGMTSLPKCHRASIAAETHVYTVDNPAFISGGAGGVASSTH